MYIFMCMVAMVPLFMMTFSTSCQGYYKKNHANDKLVRLYCKRIFKINNFKR